MGPAHMQAPSPLRLATVLIHAAASAAFSLPALPSRAAPRCAVACGFSVDTVDQKAIEDLGVFNWPGLERRVQDFADAAVSGKLKMVYVKSGSATIEDGEDSADISAGQMVMIDDKGETRWSKISEEGLVLLSCETVLAEEGAAAEEAVAASAGQRDLSGKPLGDAIQEDSLDVTLGGLLTQLALGLASGGMLAVGVKLFVTPDSP